MSLSPSALVKPVRPDPAEVHAQTQQLSAAIEKYAARIQEIKETTASRRGRRGEPSAEERTLVKSLQETRRDYQTALREKQSLRDALNKANQARESARVKVRQIKATSKVSSIDEIDAQIKRLEEKVNSAELTEREEADCVEKIRQLVRSRETVRSLRKQLDSMQSDDGTSEELMNQLRDVDSEMDKCSLRAKELKKALDALQKKREAEETDVTGLISEKEECWQVLCALRAKKKEINDAFTDRMKIYRKELDAYHMQKRETEKKEAKAVVEEVKVVEKPAPKGRQRTGRSDNRSVRLAMEDPAQVEERERQKKEARRRRQEEQEQARRLEKPKEDPVPAVEGPVVQSNDVTALSGMKPLKKSENEEDAWMMGGGKGKKPKHKKNKKSAKMEKPEDKILMHALPIFQAFNDLKVVAPDTLADVPRAIDTIEQLKQTLQGKPAKREEAAPVRQEATADAGVHVEEKPASTDDSTSLQEVVAAERAPPILERLEPAGESAAAVLGQSGAEDSSPVPEVAAAELSLPIPEKSARVEKTSEKLEESAADSPPVKPETVAADSPVEGRPLVAESSLPLEKAVSADRNLPVQEDVPTSEGSPTAQAEIPVAESPVLGAEPLPSEETAPIPLQSGAVHSPLVQEASVVQETAVALGETVRTEDASHIPPKPPATECPAVQAGLPLTDNTAPEANGCVPPGEVHVLCSMWVDDAANHIRFDVIVFED